MIDFALCRAYKVLIIVSVLRLLSRERGRPYLKTLPVGHDEDTMVRASTVWLPLILPVRVSPETKP